MESQRIFRSISVAAGLMTVLAGLACGPAPLPEKQAAEADGRLSVFVSILPQAYFVERVGGDKVQVDVLVRPGESPATYSATPRQMAELSRAVIYFRIGVPFENGLVPKIRESLPGLRIVDTRRGIALRRMKTHLEEIMSDEAPAGGEHDHDHSAEEGDDPHIWLDPMRVKQQAATIREALVVARPAERDYFEENYRIFARELDDLHQRLTRLLAPVRGREIFVFHPAYGYFAEAYGLRQVAVEMGGKEPGARYLAAFIELARSRRVRVVFVQPQFSRHAAETIARAIDGAVVPLDPLARDYMANMERMALEVEQALRQ
jgi:zinc transport system substrate-binding protein